LRTRERAKFFSPPKSIAGQLGIYLFRRCEI
jgi:hypothetical protein